MASKFNVGDKVRVRAIDGLSNSMNRYIGLPGTVEHTERFVSPYSGEISQVSHVRFDIDGRTMKENSSLFDFYCDCLFCLEKRNAGQL